MPTEIPQLAPNLAQPALRFAVVSDDGDQRAHAQRILFQSALRFAVVSDVLVSGMMTSALGFNPL